MTTPLETITEDVTPETPELADTWTAPTKEEWELVQSRLTAANGEAASRKRWLRDLGYDPKTGVKLTGTEADETAEVQPAHVDADALVKSAEAKTAAIYIALAEAGVGPKSLARVSKMIDKGSLSIGESGIEGLTSQVDALKEELPELFKKSRVTHVPNANAVGAGDKQAPAEAPKDWRQKATDQILGR
ncbi:phage scaffolding protein [Streptomyces sp. NPDC057307]|uniref:phage scaffolding protein n=1 Tax=Streptomyces sp. NPDC057307 TaxID=3346096 RepID=UPI00362A3416